VLLICFVCVTVMQDRDYEGLVETRLYLGVATPSSFRAYTVVAENPIAITTKLVQLLHSTRLLIHVVATKTVKYVTDF